MKRKIIPYHPKLKDFARRLRKDITPGEIKLWMSIKNGQFYGFDFHRQKPLLAFIVDFYCAELDLVIELDGRYHNNEEKYNKDVKRDLALQQYGLTVLRFDEQEVMHDFDNVLRTIETFVLKHVEENTPNPSQERNEAGVI